MDYRRGIRRMGKRAHSPTTSLASEFDVPGPWDEREEFVFVRCSMCYCTNQGTPEEMAEVLTSGFGLRVMKAFPGCRCNCHHGNGRLPQLLVKREVR